MSPFAYSSLVVSRGSPQMAFTSLVVIPTRGIVATGRAGSRDLAAFGGTDTLVFAASAVAGHIVEYEPQMELVSA